MKNKILIKLTSLALIAVLFISCEKTAMEKAQDAYDASMVVPAVLGVSGASLVLQTFSYDYNVTYYRAGSTWNWTADGATIESVSGDSRSATVLFDQLPASGKAYVNITETTSGGTTSPIKAVEVTVNAFCPLPNGLDDLVGSWSGDDADYESIITTAVEEGEFLVSGMSVGFINDFWGEEVIDGGTFVMTVNDNGTLNIPRQYIYTTEYEGDPYDYEIAGSGTWDNCSATPTFVITYDIYYPGDAKGLAATYAAYLDNIPYLTADISLDANGKKSAPVVERKLKTSPRK